MIIIGKEDNKKKKNSVIDFEVFVLKNVLSKIEHILNVFGENNFYNSGRALMFFIIKMHYLKSSIRQSKETNNFYSSCVLYRSFLEHYFKYMYVYSRALREKDDLVGKQYYNELKGYEDLTFFISMQNLNIKLDNSKIIWKTGGNNNENIKNVAKQFEIKSILSYLHKGIDSKEIKPMFVSYFSDYCKKYYDLSSFVHGGPFAESYFKLYSADKEKAGKDLNYFSQTSEELFRGTVESSLLFLSLLDDSFELDYNSIKKFKSLL